MNATRDGDRFDENLAKLIPAAICEADDGFEKRLEAAVLEAVAEEQRAPRRMQRPGFRVLAVTAAAALVLTALVVYSGRARSAGEVHNVYGIVTVADGAPARQFEGTISLAAGQRIATAWGSRAFLTLRDGSTLVAGPKTLLSVKDRPDGFTLTLESGFLGVKAAKQPEGKMLRVETPGAEIRVLGTAFDVYVADRNGGPRKTEVAVRSGKVAVESGGRTVVLAPDMEATAAEGRAPVTRSKVPEINELARLAEMAAKRFGNQGATWLPAIIDLNSDATAAVWIVQPVSTADSTLSQAITVAAGLTFGGAGAFTSEGLPLNMETNGSVITVDLASLPGGATRPDAIVVRLDGVKGLFRKENSVLRFERPAGGLSAHAVLEMRIPEAAWFSVHSAEPLEDRVVSGRQVLVLDTRAAALGILAAAGPVGGD
jgi:ferric-dicitrate binding protein FerR (iron transport regulator)